VVAYTVNRLGSWVGLVALSLAVYDHTHSAPAVAGLLLCWQGLPAFAVPALVASVEASKRRRELSGLYAFEAVVTAGIAVLLWHFSLPAVLVLAALDGTASLAANSLLRSEVARSGREGAMEAGETMQLGVTPVGETLAGADLERAQEGERKANAVLNIAFSAAFIGGPVVGGVLTAGLGAPAALFVDVASFLFCGLMLLDLHPHVKEAGGSSVRERLSVAWQHINTFPGLRPLLLTEGLALLFIQAAGPIEVILAKATLHAGDRGYGLLVASWGAGALLGSVIFARASRLPLGAVLSAGTLALGAAFLGYALAPTLLVACIAAAVGGLGNTLEWPALISLVQRMTPQPLHGRLMGAVESLSALCIAAGLLLGGALVALSSARTAFLIIGLGTAVASAGFVRLTLIGMTPAADVAAQAGTSEGAAQAAAAPLPHEPATE
jgi:MFS family permease